MKRLLITGLICMGLSSLVFAQEREVDFNFDWRFALQQDTTLPKKIPLDDVNWRTVRLPHDWSVEHPFSEKWDGATGYLPGGVGVYQKHFVTDANPNEKSTYILFDGVYNNAAFWLNGKKLGENPYGYSPVYFNLTNLLNEVGKENTLTVHVDHSRYVDSRWYSGSGIYRNVKIVTLDKLHIPIWGTFIKTPEVSADKASIDLDVKIENELTQDTELTLLTKIFDAKGVQVALQSHDVVIIGNSTQEFNQNFVVEKPMLWHFDAPNMYKAITYVYKDGAMLDQYTTPFGIRKLEFKADEGFYLNDKNTLIKGVCLHHDGGLVGAAVPKGVWKRRLQKLKEAGVNGIRLSHNPFSTEFLDLCDEMGFLVQNELFDEWDYPKDKRENYHDRHTDYISRGYSEHFREWSKSDLTRTILRDRNHPSVMQWSIGNEIEWTYLHYRFVTGFWKDRKDPQNHDGTYWGSPPMFTPQELKKRYKKSKKGEYILTETAKRLNGWVKALDSTRTTCANLIIPQVSHVSGFADAVDVVGYSYRNSEIAWGQKHFPNKQITITECPGSWDDWKQVLENPGVYSMYMWTGIGYMGERYNDWPSKSGFSDMLNIAGFKVQGWNYFKSVWVDEPHISFGTVPISEMGLKKNDVSGQQLPENFTPNRWRDTNMHWNYNEGEDIVVEIATNFSTIELFLNGRSLGYRSMSEASDRILRWVVPYEKGRLTAKGVFDGKVTTAELSTTTKLKGFTLTADKTELKADGYDVSHLVLQLVDDQGRAIKTENRKVTFEIVGAAKLLGVDTGEEDNIQNFQSDTVVTGKGRCLAIIQSKKEAGEVVVIAKIDGLQDESVTLTMR